MVILRGILLLAGALCALALVWLALVLFAFRLQFGEQVLELNLICAALLAGAAAMGWVVLRLWRGGPDQRTPRRVALGRAGIGVGLALWSGWADPGDAVFTV
ncbi:MAG: hypothetical protein JNJ84_16865, partial [Rhodobacteraceae bacterium]|nr:hypothetical protein [Paracoccaceae bacterium]